MSDRLLELAARFQVATHDGPMIERRDGSREYIGPRIQRHDLDIAHELLSALPGEWSLMMRRHRLTQSFAMTYYAKSPATRDQHAIESAHSEFIEAVCALAERALGEKGT